MNSPAPGSVERAQAVGVQASAVARRPARNDVRGTGKWLMIVSALIFAAGFVVYRVIVGDTADGYGMLAVMVGAPTLLIAASIGLIGMVMWLIGVARAGREGPGEA